MWSSPSQPTSSSETATPSSLMGISHAQQSDTQAEETAPFPSLSSIADTEMADSDFRHPQPGTADNADSSSEGTPTDDQSEPRRSSLLDAAVENLILKAERTRNRESLGNSHWTDLKLVQNAQDEFAISFSKGDTLIIINVPSGHEPNVMCNEQRYPLQQRLRFDSSIFHQRGFGKIGELLSNEKYQARLRRRLVSAGEIIPEGVRYVVDLGPSTDEDLAPEQLEALSLSKGVMRWYLIPECYPGIPNSIVGGHDDCCTCESSFAAAHRIQPKPREDSGDYPEKRHSIWDIEIGSSFRKIDDYCEVRHAANVVRLLRAMAGKGLLLDSAPRVYTIAGLAKLFGFDPAAGGSWLQNEVWSWFFDDKNSVFLEVLPEESLRIATNLKIPIIARLAFRILVAEKALEVTAGGLQSRPSRKSVFGRPLGDIDDDMRTAVEHASQNMADRVNNLLEKLRAFDVFDHLNIGEWKQLCAVWTYLQTDHPDVIASLQGPFSSLTLALTDWFTKKLLGLLASPADAIHINAMAKNQKHLTPAATQQDLKELYVNLTPQQKALTSPFWKIIRESWPTYPMFGASKINGTGKTLEQHATRFNNSLLKAMESEGVDLNTVFPKTFTYHVSQSIQPQPWRFNTFTFYDEATVCLKQICSSMYDPPHYKCDIEIPVMLSDHLLLSLEDSEFRFLPLWAGGYDDGTGGVFTDALPAAEMGPNGPGPSYHTGYTVATDASVTDDMSFERLNVRSVTSGEGHSSNVVQDSISTVYNRFRVMAVDDDDSIAPDDSFSVANDTDFDDAMHAVPADNQARADALYEYVMQEQADTPGSSEAPVAASATGGGAGNGREEQRGQGSQRVASPVDEGFDMDDDDEMDVSSDSGTLTPVKASVEGSDSALWTML
ncbi:uncharacterized protein E0L32_008574 [Thyridium curvatum]|uniref:Uncharacterized protein n=1 Tax=Thyridium curvatum TaxID=1093900 RepID=A0A507AVK7_9PEZI|nr:uncharacterized protein E0L32_008574 [Thyridium curvatum]TPX10524.1 hypothetical protein E0L32_008574 [Thyridium curvatum]